MRSLTANHEKLFINKDMFERVTKLHHELRTLHEGILTNQPTLLDYLADPNTGFRNGAHQALIKKAFTDYAPGDIPWKIFGFKAGPEIAMLKARHEFVWRLWNLKDGWETILDSEYIMKVSDLQFISYFGHQPSVALAIKMYWNKYHSEIYWPKWCSDDENRGGMRFYRGYLSTTKPVKEAIKAIWGNVAGGDLIELSDFQHRAAHELNVCPQVFNSMLWILGKDFLKEPLLEPVPEE